MPNPTIAIYLTPSALLATITLKTPHATIPYQLVTITKLTCLHLRLLLLLPTQISICFYSCLSIYDNANCVTMYYSNNKLNHAKAHQARQRKRTTVLVKLKSFMVLIFFNLARFYQTAYRKEALKAVCLSITSVTNGVSFIF